MPNRTYIGPCAEVEVPLPDGQNIIVKHGEQADFPAEFAARLDEQPSNWAKAKPVTTKPEA